MTDFETKLATLKRVTWALTSSVTKRSNALEREDVEQELLLSAWQAYRLYKERADVVGYMVQTMFYKSKRLVDTSRKTQDRRQKAMSKVFLTLDRYGDTAEEVVLKCMLDDAKSKISGKTLKVFELLEKGYGKYDASKILEVHPYMVNFHLKKIRKIFTEKTTVPA